jgi:hypothetical protein
MSHSRIAAAVVLCLSLSSVAFADDPYDAAKDAEGRLDYKAVVAQAKRALGMPQTHDRLVEIYRLLGTANGVLGHNDEAVDAFTKLLAVDPDHRLPRGLSPKITRPFQEAGGYWIDRPGGLTVTPDMPREAQPGKPIVIAVKLQDPLHMAENVRLSWRREGDVEFQHIDAAVGGGISLTIPTGGGPTVTIPADQVQSRKADYNVELYLTALSASGGELRSSGDAIHPLSVIVRVPRDLALVPTGGETGTTVTVEKQRKPRGPLIKQWWFWTAVGGGAVAIGLGVGLGIGLTRDTSHVDLNVTSK